MCGLLGSSRPQGSGRRQGGLHAAVGLRPRVIKIGDAVVVNLGGALNATSRTALRSSVLRVLAAAAMSQVRSRREHRRAVEGVIFEPRVGLHRQRSGDDDGACSNRISSSSGMCRSRQEATRLPTRRLAGRSCEQSNHEVGTSICRRSSASFGRVPHAASPAAPHHPMPSNRHASRCRVHSRHGRAHRWLRRSRPDLRFQIVRRPSPSTGTVSAPSCLGAPNRRPLPSNTRWKAASSLSCSFRFPRHRP